MLRAVVLALGFAALGSALLAALCQAPLPLILWLAIVGVALVGGILFERGRYKPSATRHPGPDWQATGERFIDPESGKSVTVYYQPATGERRYVGH
jgi:hypothetical protein